MSVKSRLFTPTLTFLSDHNKDKIHQAALDILAQVGMKILHAQALDLLVAAGCKVENDHIVKIPSDLVLQAIDSTPKNIAVYDRQANHCMDVGGRRAYFGTGSDLIFSHDAAKNERRPCVLEDVCRAARVADALPNIDFIMSFAHPSDYPPQLGYLVSFQAMAAHSSKPIVSTARGRDDLAQMWQICCVLRGSAKRLREKPLMIHYSDPISPLKHPFYSLGKLLFCAETCVPLRETQWRPGLISRIGYEEWQSAGATSLRERSQKKVQDILRDHRPVPIPAEQAREIQKIVDQFAN
jgi:trimethylamine--corrinoid protein Co-methyltransferase